MAIHFKLLKSTAAVSAGIFSLAVISKQLAPLIIDIVVPVVYSSVVLWLRPPFLYLVMNFIILSIVVTSKFQHNKPIENDLPYLSPEITVINPTVEETNEDATFTEMIVDDEVAEVFTLLDPPEEKTFTEMRVDDEVVEVFTLLDPPEVETFTEMRDDEVAEVFTLLDPPEEEAEISVTIENVRRRPPLSLSARFGNKKSAKGGSTDKSLKVTKPKRQDTLESTWKTITEGRSMPLTRHLKKSDTWDSRLKTTITSVSPPEPSKIEKSETFKEHTDEESTPVFDSKLKKEPSLSQDELNRKVEAFINKFNEEMRLQRQKSLDQYKQMTSIY